MKETRRIDRVLKYEAHRVKVYEDILEQSDGTVLYYDYVKNRDGAGMLLVDEEERVILVRQYRNVEDKVLLEIPAGISEAEDKDTSVTALREAEEETGLIPERIKLIGNIINAVGLFDEHTAIYVGKDLRRGTRHLDPGESIDLVRLPFTDALDMIYRGEIYDGKTVIALLGYRDLKQRGLF
ncbi:MAG: NUDIX hydrolase [Eubacterium sp.]|nr:NUDIX hydrolase [Eubacterium sp.]